MRRLDRLILGELLGPWGFGVAIFTSLILAGTYLFKVTEYIVAGVSIWTVFQYTLYLLPGILVKTFAMAMLLATLLAFGRLSSDSEIVAMRAAGASLHRVMAPVAIFGLIVAGFAFLINERLVPYAAMKGTAMKEVIEKHVSGGGQPVSYPIYEGHHLMAYVMAKDFDLQERSLKGVAIVAFTMSGKPTFFFYSDKIVFGNLDKLSLSNQAWQLPEGGRLIPYDGTHVTNVGQTWPAAELPAPPKPEDIVAMNVRDLDSYSMRETRAEIEKHLDDPNFPIGQLLNLEYGYYNKLALPLAALIFGLVGAPLGIRNHRTGAAVGFWLSVIIIFGYMMLTNLMFIYAQGGVFPPYVASFSPLVIGLIFAIVLIQRKNV